MKRLISITLLVAFLGSTTELHELFKITHLIIHYFNHRSEQIDIGLVEFIHVHYSHDHDNHKDEHHDRGCLPFQGEHSHIQLTHFYTQGNVDIKLIPPINSLDKNSYNQSFPLSEYLAQIWQPPKV